MKGNQFRIILTTAAFTAIFSSCTFLTELNKVPGNVFISKDILSNNIRKIALLPMLPDTKDSNGTYNATNYFLEMLVTEYPGLEFAEINDIRKCELGFLPQLIDDISDFKIMNRKAFLDTDLGMMLKEWNCDAILLGKIDSLKRLPASEFGRYAISYITYYLISLKDGKVLWKTSEFGSHFYKKVGWSATMYLLDDNFASPIIPIDIPICNAVEKLADKLPEEIFNKDM